MSSPRQSTERRDPQPLNSLRESWQRGTRLVSAYVSISMVLFPVAIAFGHAPGVSMTQTIGGGIAAAAGITLAVGRWRPNAQPISWRLPFVVLVGYGIGEQVLGIQQYSPGWIAARNSISLYIGLLLVVLAFRLSR